MRQKLLQALSETVRPFRLGLANSLVPAPESFVGHYAEWRAKRLAAILEHYGPSFFRSKTLLEVGCGYGDFGSVFAKLGAEVTCSDGRPEHLQMVALRHPDVKRQLANLESEWPFARQDVVLHMGVLYHLSHFEEPLRLACASCRYLVLETEVADSDDPNYVIHTEERGPDQAISGKGIRPSAGAIERVLDAAGMRFQHITDDRCNAGFHRYDWPVTNSGKWEHGLRRFWFAERR